LFRDLTMMKKIVIASDAFKGSLSSREVAQGAMRGVYEIKPECEVIALSVADGGEGTVEAIVEALGGEIVEAQVSDPLGRTITARYGVAGDTAVIEMAAASGLPLLSVEERNPWFTSTFGTGEMIMDAISRGCRQFLVGIGGSATNDAGTGMLQALGFRFYDINDRLVEHCSGGRLQDIVRIDDTQVPAEVKDSIFTVACDVDTPFCGPEGAAPVFAPQKGADAEMVSRLDAGMASLAKVIEDQYALDVIPVAGAGAAGGIGGAFYAFLHAKLKKGIDMVLDAIDFDTTIQGADLVITGEGRIDKQTVMGKAPSGVLAVASKHNIPTIAIGGGIEWCEELHNSGFAEIVAVTPEGMTLEEAMNAKTAKNNIRHTARRIAEQYLSK
jgi:glycerate kinase